MVSSTPAALLSGMPREAGKLSQKRNVSGGTTGLGVGYFMISGRKWSGLGVGVGVGEGSAVVVGVAVNVVVTVIVGVKVIVGVIVMVGVTVSLTIIDGESGVVVISSPVKVGVAVEVGSTTVSCLCSGGAPALTDCESTSRKVTSNTDRKTGSKVGVSCFVGCIASTSVGNCPGSSLKDYPKYSGSFPAASAPPAGSSLDGTVRRRYLRAAHH